jgi:hypothetical protein
MTTDGGGWTLVWNNLRGSRGKQVTEITWGAAINTTPRVTGALSGNIESFSVFTGLKHWAALSPSGLLRFDWSADYATAVAERAEMQFTLDPNNFYTISLSGFTQTIGSQQPGLYLSHNNQKFSTYDAKHDTWTSGTCSTSFSNTPWWYSACWSGSINGGGEFSGTAYFNGAYWFGSDVQWGDPATGKGAGNGWIYVK